LPRVIDPIEDRKAVAAAGALAAAKATTFKQCAESYIAAMRPGWKNAKHAAQWDATLATYVHPTIGALPVAGVDTDLVVKVLSPIWTTKAETASRLRGRIEAVLEYAKVRGLRTGENPARWRGHLSHILPAKGDVAKVQHHRAMADGDLPAWWPRLQAHDGLGARALELAILTATRTGEVLGARWDEFDMDEAVWTIPPARMKAGQEHRVPLNEPALALLCKLAAIRTGPFLFAARPDQPLSSMSILMALRRMKAGCTAHGFRSTFRTWAAEQTTTPHEVAEAALAHSPGSKLVAAYQRGDMFAKRRDLMRAWGRFIAGADAKVLTMRVANR
jgi:integrase